MGKLQSSGAISLDDVRTLFGRTGSISMSEFASGQPLYVDKYNVTDLTVSNGYLSGSIYWQAVTQQNATGGNGSGTVTTGYYTYARYRGSAKYLFNSHGTSYTGNSGSTYQNLDDFMGWGEGVPTFWQITDPSMTLSRGSLVSTGSYGAWTNTTDSKGNITGSYRTKGDFYRLNISNSKKATSRTEMNPGLSSGARSFSEMYDLDNGIILDTTFTHSSTDSNGATQTIVLGFSNNGSGTSYGSMANVNTTSRDSRHHGMKVVSCYKSLINNFFYFQLQCPATTVTGDIELGKFSKIEINGAALYPQNTDSSYASGVDTNLTYASNSTFQSNGYQFIWSSGTFPTINSSGTNTLKIYA